MTTATISPPQTAEDFAAECADRAQSPGTMRAYATDARAFTAWCTARDRVALPALPDSVALFLAHEALRGIKAATLNRRVAAIRAAHLAVDLTSPTDAPYVRRVLRGIRRARGVRQTKKAPVTADILARMLAQTPDTLAGTRDRAILLLGFGGAFRRSELVALEVQDLAELPGGFTVTVQSSKTDQEGAGETVPVARGRVTCPVEAVRAWLSASGLTQGPLFRPITSTGKVRGRALTPHSIGRLVKAYAARVGLNPAEFGGHSLRAGFITSAAANGSPLDKLMVVSRHKRVDTLMGYIRHAEAFKNHAGDGLL